MSKEPNRCLADMYDDYVPTEDKPEETVEIANGQDIPNRR